MTAYWVTVEEADLTRLGEIRSVLAWESEDPLDRAGKFRFQMPATDSKAELLSEKRIVRCYTVINNTVTQVGSGLIDKIEVQLGAGGTSLLAVEGDNLLRELTNRQVGSLSIDDSSGGPADTGPADIIAYAPSGWALDTLSGYDTTAKSVLHAFEGETVLAALVRLSELTGEHFRAGANRTVIWMQNDQPDSGVRAVQTGDPTAILANPAVCMITDLARSSDSYDLVTRVYPYGAGDGDARVTLAGSSWVAPGGFTIDTLNNFIKANTADTTYGQIERYVSFKDIATNDTLAEVAYEWLRKRSAAVVSYRLSIAGLQSTLTPGSTIHVQYRKWVENFQAVNIDADLVILSATNRLDQYGFRTVGLEVASQAAWPENDATTITAMLTTAQASYTHSQPISGSGSTAHNHTNDQVVEDVRSVSTTQPLTNSDRVILASGTITLTLPAASTKIRLTIINTGSGTITIQRAGSDTINGGTGSLTNAVQYTSNELVSDGGTAWYTI